MLALNRETKQNPSQKWIEVYLCLAVVAAWVWNMYAEMLLKHESRRCNHILANAYALRPLSIHIYVLWNSERDVPVWMLRKIRNTSEVAQCKSRNDCEWIRMVMMPPLPRLRSSGITCRINHGTYFISPAIWPNWMRCRWNKSRARRKTMECP